MSDCSQVRIAVALALALALATGCARLRPYRTPPDANVWQDTSPPRLSLAEKAHAYQSRLEARHQLPDGMIRYRFDPVREAALEQRGDYADGCFFAGIYLASQALRYADTGDAEARRQLDRALEGARLFAELSGERGLLVRYFSPSPRPEDPVWRPSPTRPGYYFRSDVSKDQYAGYVHGLGVALAVVPDPEIREQLAALAAAVADHMIENDLRIVDWDGERTTYGDLRGRIYGLPIGINALIVLAIAKTAAVATGEPRYADFYARLVDEGYADRAYWAHVSAPGQTKRVNDNMGYLALYPLLLLEEDPEIAETLRRSGRRTWRHVQGEHNAFFAFVQAAVVESSLDGRDARAEGLAALADFPDRKTRYPVDLTREDFDFPRSFWNDSKGRPRSKRPIPLHLRPRGSSLWVSDPYRMVSGLGRVGDMEFSGIDYLSAYWIGRYHGFVGPTQ